MFGRNKVSQEEIEKIKTALREKSAQALIQRINVIKQMFNIN